MQTPQRGRFSQQARLDRKQGFPVWPKDLGLSRCHLPQMDGAGQFLNQEIP